MKRLLIALIAVSAFGQQVNPYPPGTRLVPVSSSSSSGSGGTYCAGAGTNTITCAGSPVPTSYTAGMVVTLLAGGNNSGATTVNIASLGAKAVISSSGAALSGGEIVSGSYYSLSYNGTSFVLGGGTASAYPTVTDASPIAWSLGSAIVTNGIVTLAHGTATRALNLTNLVNGGFYTLIVKQDSTGGAAMTGGTGCTWLTPAGPGTNTFPISTGASAVSSIAFTYDGTNCYVVTANAYAAL